MKDKNTLIAVKNMGNRFKVEYVTERPENLVTFMQTFGNGCQMAATTHYVRRGFLLNGNEFVTMDQYQKQKKEEQSQHKNKAIQY